MQRKAIYKPGHVLASIGGRIPYSRYLFYENNIDKKLSCQWCGLVLYWRTGMSGMKKHDSVCVDHLDRDTTNDDLSNLAPSCRQCNANRHDYGRRPTIECPVCKSKFTRKRPHSVYCSIQCANKNKPKRKLIAKCGTRTRYVWGCRCDKCRSANAMYARKNRKNNKLMASVGCHQLEVTK